jgi:hypothetical protein
LKDVIGKGFTKSRTDLFNLIIDPTTYTKLLGQLKPKADGTYEENTDLFSTKK